MASTTIELNETYQLISDGSATIQKQTKGYGSALIYAGTGAPLKDDTSMEVITNDPQYFETADSLYARTPHGKGVNIVVMA